MDTLQPKEKIEKTGEFYQKIEEASKEYVPYWVDTTLFHWDFWISIFFTIAPIVFWMKFRKKSSSNRLLFSGMFVAMIASGLDYLGVQYGKWYYTGKTIPLLLGYVPWDVVILPIFVMILIQIKPKMTPIGKGLIFASVSAFIGEPLFLWVGLYVIKDWSIVYSFPIYVVIYLLADKLSKVTNFEPVE